MHRLSCVLANADIIILVRAIIKARRTTGVRESGRRSEEREYARAVSVRDVRR